MAFLTKTKAVVFGTLQKVKPRLPEKYKGGRIERIVNYFNNIYVDYRSAAVDMVQDMKEARVKTAAYVSLIGVVCTMLKTNPDEEDYRNCLVAYSVDLGHVGSGIRNPHSADTVASLMKSYEGGNIRRTNLFLFSLIRMDQRSNKMDLYMAKSKYVRPHWMEFYHSVIDVGVFGRWINLNKAMVEYDVNPDEWK